MTNEVPSYVTTSYLTLEQKEVEINSMIIFTKSIPSLSSYNLLTTGKQLMIIRQPQNTNSNFLRKNITSPYEVSK